MQLVPRGAPPTMTAAFAVQETPDSLDGLRVELVFDRPVAADSVAQAVVVDPPLPLLHRVHQNKVELIPGTSVSLGSSYRLVVDQVRDERGNTQSEPVALHLATWPVAMVNQASAPPALPRPGATQASGEEKQGAEANGGLVPAPLTQRPPAELRSQLGLPLGSPKPVQITEQTFQGGAMLVRSDSGQVLVLNRSTARWDSFASTWRPGEVLPPVGMARPPGTFEPLRALGKVWREQPAVKLQLGWPVFEERLAPGSVQSFENGVLIHSSFGLIYALFHDGAWRTLPDPRR